MTRRIRGYTVATMVKKPSRPAAKQTGKQTGKPPGKQKGKPKATAKAKPAAAPAAKKKKPPLAWTTPAELSAAWNAAGRAHFLALNPLLERLYNGEDVAIDHEDPRTEADGNAVIAQIVALNAAGEGERARELFDPAYGPVFPWIKSERKQLRFVTILGPDELLVVHGSPWLADNVAYHLRGGTATPVPDVRCLARSRNRDHLIVGRAAGLAVYDARAGVAALARTPIAELAWPPMSIFVPRGLSPEQAAAGAAAPEEAPLQLESMQVSDDGKRFVLSCYRQGILLGSVHAGDPPWQLLHPDARPPYRSAEDTDIPRAGDMTHVAISRDGRRLAWGSQDTPHYTAEIGAGGEARWYATVGNLSEYPHDACFSDDGRFVAFNSCHFYNGATVAFAWDGNRGARLEPYEAHQAAPLIDGNLRVYASCWLPPDVLTAIGDRPTTDGAFALAGSGILRVVTRAGKLALVQGFGSSASSIDFCPESRRLAIGGYSGMVHLYDPYAAEQPGRNDGVRPRRELARWCFWGGLPDGPIRW